MTTHPSTRLAADAVRDAGGCVAFHPIARIYLDLGRVASAVCQPFER
ncbi:hypothetical protein ODJ79_27830 [Actinoplanes sp. KI2]|nr:hypothetical protein [Actinoplanes sp. KI2]MCU7727545.1 hypothetical protein [Actinoplanes sp. KI2]